jgi:hypothetical protein
MNQTEFWALIGQSKQAAGIDTPKQTEWLIAALGKLSLEEILAFEWEMIGQMDRAYASHLWAAAHIVLGGCSDDWFDYFRGWLVAQGEATFERAMAGPESLSEPFKAYLAVDDEPVSEGMLYISRKAYQAQTGRDDFWVAYESRFGRIAPRPHIDFDWDDSDESLKRILPGLFAAFWPES